MSNNKKSIFIITIILVLIALIGVGTYAVLTWVSTENTELTIKIGEVAGVYFDTGPNINISNIGPIFDYEKDGETTYFTVSNYIEEELPINATLNITTISNNLKEESFKYILMSSSDKENYTIVKEDNFVNVSSNTSIELVKDYILAPGSNITYKLIIYIDGNMENPITMQGGTLSGVISVSANNGNGIDKSGANYPELTDGLIPVMYDGTTWVTADVTSSTSTYGWYDYDAKKWANAVLVKDANVVSDLSSSGKDGIISGATHTNEGLSFDGVDDYIKLPNDLGVSFPMTYSIKFKTNTTNEQIIFGNPNTQTGLGLYNKNNTLILNTCGSSTPYVFNTGGLTLNTFYTIDIVYNSLTNMSVYLNGVKLSTGSSTNCWTWNASESYIGKRDLGTNFSGVIEKFILYNDALTEMEIKNNLSVTNDKICDDGIICDNLSVYYNFKLGSNSREHYQTASVGTEVLESDILGFYVWIPRYKYKVWNKDKKVGTDTYNAQTKGIDIVFESGTEKTGGITCTYSYAAPSSSAGSPNEKCTDSGSEGYYTHPAFTFGNDELTGFWMSKFEVSSSTPLAQYGGRDDITLTPRVLPNVISWSGASGSTFWKVIKDMQVSNNIYGLSTDTTKVDTHMLTNMEWGAVAYLTHSKYGRCTGGTNSTCIEVSINNSSNRYTGKSSGAPGSSSTSTSPMGTYSYNEAKGQLASTTGNIYGVYDMSGGRNEIVMGNMSKSSGSYSYNVSYAGTYYTYSGNEKYLTTYAYGTGFCDQSSYNRGRLGDATSEVVIQTGCTGGWYNDYARFPYSIDWPWLIRSGMANTDAGIFYFDQAHGGWDAAYNSTRAALTVFVDD